jgi:hypothetical protein
LPHKEIYVHATTIENFEYYNVKEEKIKGENVKI